MKNVFLEKNISKLFVLSAIFFGIIMMFLVPPFQVPDENSHFKKAYLTSRGQIIAEKVDGVEGFYFPQDISVAIDVYTNSVAGDRNKRISYADVILDDRTPISYTNVQFQTFSTANSNLVAHLVPAIGILTGKVFAKLTQGGNASVTYLLYFARFANLIMYVTLIGFAIKNTPILKKTMMLVALMPMSLFLGASVSYDSLIIGVSFLVVSYIFKLIFDQEYKFSYKNLIILAILGCIIIVIKPNYILLYLLLIFIPKNKFKDLKYLFKILGFFILVFILGYFALKIPSFFVKSVTTTQNISSGNAVSLNSLQIDYILSNPIKFFEALHNTLSHNINYYISTTVATFGLIDTYVPTFVSYLYLAIIIVMGITEMSQCDYNVHILFRIGCIILFVAVIISVFFAMYISWTPMELGVGSNTITGVQGRYFIPVLFLPLVLFKNNLLVKNKITLSALNLYEEYYLITVFSLLIVCMMFIVIRFWA